MTSPPSPALLFATEATVAGGPTALLDPDDTGSTLVERLAADLTAIGVGAITVVTRPAWAEAVRERGLAVLESPDIAADLRTIGRVAAVATGPVVLAAADIVAHRAALAQVAGRRVRKTVAAVQTGAAAADGVAGQPVMRERDMVISVGTHDHDVTRPNAVFRGILTVAHGSGLASACDEIPGVIGDPDSAAGEYGAIGLVLLALVRTGVTVSAYNVRLLRLARVDSVATARAALDGLSTVDEDRAARRVAVKEDDEFFATHAVNSYTPRLVRIFSRLGVTPTAVTWLSVVIGLGAAFAFATGNRIAAFPGAVLLYFSFVFDCCDGQLARYTGRFSRYGGWLDMIADRGKEYVVFAGLAIGGARSGQTGVWGLALAAIVVQTVRHMIDTWYGALQDTATRSLPVVPLDSREDTLGLRARAQGTAEATGGLGARLGRISAAAHGRYRSPGYWIKRSVVLPIGDRWLLIAVTAAVFGPRITFIALLVAAGCAFAYVLVGRTLRARAMRIAVMPRYDIGRQRDDGPIARLIGRLGARRVPPVAVTLPALLASLAALAVALFSHDRPIWVVLACAGLALVAALGASAPHTGALDWLTTAALRAMEYTFILVAGEWGGVPRPLVYGFLSALVLYHYDLTGRIERQATPFLGGGLLRGWDIRIVLLAAGTALGWATPTFVAGTAILGGVFVIGTLSGRLRPER